MDYYNKKCIVLRVVFSIIFVFLSFHHSQKVHSQEVWDKKSLELFKSHPKPFDYRLKAFVSYWGGTKRYLSFKNISGKEANFKSENLNRPIKVYLKSVKDKFSKIRKRNLYFFFPGIFGNHEGHVSPTVISALEKTGAHVAVIPNFLHFDYIRATPKYTRHNSLSLDRDIAYEAVNFIIKELGGTSNIKSISFIGESLGAYLAASLSRNVSESLKVENLILLWPVLNLAKSLTFFDDEIKFYTSMPKKCSALKKYFLFFKYYIWMSTPDSQKQSEEVCLSYSYYKDAFLKAIAKANRSIQNLEKAHLKKSEPRSFNEFFNNYNKFFLKFLENESAKTSLKDDVKRWEKKGTIVKIVSSRDDYLNNPGDWEELRKQTYLFEWGSHCAPLALPIWDEVMKNELLP